MKKLSYIFLLLNLFARSQTGLFINGPSTSLRVDSTSFLSVHGDFQNQNCDPINYVRFNGTLYLAGNLINNDTLKFAAAPGTGNAKKARVVFSTSSLYPSGTTASIGGLVQPQLWEVELEKGIGGSLTLSNNVKCLDTLTFKTGIIYTNGYKWYLKDPVGAPMVINHPYIKNERNDCQFFANTINDTGLVIYKTIYNYSVDINPGNIGIELTGALNIGSSLSIYRGFKPQVNAAKSGILRYYDIYSPGHSLAANVLKIKYVYNDLAYFTPGYFNLSSLSLYVSANTDMNWSPLPSAVQSTLVSLTGPVLNGVMTTSLSDLSLQNIAIDPKAFRITIADPNCINPPVSALLLDTVHICTGNTLVLDAGNNSAVPNTSLKWEWNTTVPAYTKTISVNPTLGYQKFKVALKDVRGCITRDSVIVAPEAPYPQISYLNHLNSCFGDSIIIKDTVKIASGTYSNNWMFSDASTSATLQQFFKKKFSTTGNHAYQLITTSNYGCSDTAIVSNVIVYPLPTASFSNSFNCSTNLMTFTNTSVSNYSTLVISGSLWTLGQGPTNTSTLTNPSQSYTSSGTYSVKLLVTSSFGCKDSVTHPIVIYPANQALFTKNNSCLNDTVFLNNTSACNTGNCNYLWSFGDATQSILSSPKKVYSSPGLYLIKLKINASFGCPDSVTTSVFVNPIPNTLFSSSASTLCVNNFVYFSNASSISSGSINAYQWDFANNTSSNSINASTSHSNAGIYSVSLTAISDSGCVGRYTSPISIQPQPIAQYTATPVCFGSPSQFISTSTGVGLSYLWNYGNSVISTTNTSAYQQYNYPSTGTYSTQLVVFNTWGCSDTASVTTSVLPSPTAALGGSVSTCGTSYTLNSGNSGSSYLWQPGNQTTQSIQVLNSGLYQVSITNTNGCTGTETVLITLNALVKPLLGNDSTVCGSFVLNGGYPGSSYLWNTSSTSQTLLVTSSGTYSVQVTDLNGCVGGDTISLFINQVPTLSLGNNLSICKPKYGLVLSPTTNASNYYWNNGSTNPTLNVNTNGNYWVEVSLANGCKMRDTITVIFLSTPLIELGSDRSVCGSIVLDAQNAGANYMWSNGSSSQTISISNSDTYWVSVTNTLSNCSIEDSVNINVHPLVNVSLGNDTTVCDNTRFFLDAGNSGSTYLWTNSLYTQTVPISSTGIYGVTVTNTGGCFAADYINISLVGSPTVNLGRQVKYLCGNNTVDLGVNSNGSVQWQSASGFVSLTKSVSISQAGKYWVTLSEFGCNASDTILIVPTNNTIQALFLASTQDTINKPVKFVNLSTPLPTNQLWSFGDGQTSNAYSPLHTYVLPQDYSVTLEVSNGYCWDRITKQLSALFKQTAPAHHLPSASLQLLSLNLYPNPADNYVRIESTFNESVPLKLWIADVTGKIVAMEIFEARTINEIRINLNGYPNGLYFLTLHAKNNKGEISKTLKFIKTN